MSGGTGGLTSADVKVRARPDVVSSELADGAALLDLRSSMYYSVNAVGHQVWLGVQTPATIGELVSQVSEAFDVTPQRCEADVRTMVEDLIEKGLVDVADA